MKLEFSRGDCILLSNLCEAAAVQFDIRINLGLAPELRDAFINFSKDRRELSKRLRESLDAEEAADSQNKHLTNPKT